jgi:hypothetical protein
MPDEVRDVAESLERMDRAQLDARYARLPQQAFEHMNWAKDEEYRYELWKRLNKLKRFYRRTALEGRAVVFYTDDPLDYFFTSERGSESAP